MSFRLPLHSIRTKFLLVGLAAVLLCGSVSFFLAAEERRQLEEQLRSSAVNMANQARFVMGPLVAFDSRHEMKQALELLRTNPDFAWARVSDETGAPLVSVGSADAVRSGSFDVVVANISEAVMGEMRAELERVASKRILSGFQDERGEWACVVC